MTFRLGTKSEDNLIGVNPRLVRLPRRAIVTTTVDFGVHDGVRTIEEQRQNVINGVSWTMDSQHLPHPEDGLGRALDLVPYINGKLRWEWKPAIQVAIAMREASIHFQEPVTWGGVWDRRLSELDPMHMEDEIEEFVARFMLKHKRKPSVDVPHYQMLKKP